MNTRGQGIASRKSVNHRPASHQATLRPQRIEIQLSELDSGNIILRHRDATLRQV